MNPFDLSVFHAINSLAGRSHILDALMEFFAKYSPETLACVILLAWFLLPREEEESRHRLVMSVVAACMALLLNVVLSHVWPRERPFVVMPHNVHQLLAHPADASFPSDHAAGVFSVAATLWGMRKRLLTYSVTLLSILVLIARVFVGVHWPTDVLGGMFCGIAAGRFLWGSENVFQPITQFGLRMFSLGRYVRTKTE